MKLDQEELLEQCEPGAFLRGLRLFEQHAAHVIEQKRKDNELKLVGMAQGIQIAPCRVELLEGRGA